MNSGTVSCSGRNGPSTGTGMRLRVSIAAPSGEKMRQR
jgi:hypothetical protein